ncbi:hypothetical protein [Arthrobacter bussei]|uniref:Uncharacterized protein n=1 Tax=Arthrobacter bussei TaxID=2594179 RepID=A0A7X1TNM1_9MICC|nr:hypothetical protein [Arthrobacter bussei]MPY10718.1 hypothetical protein [Arthrobacter bussei]
MALMGAQKARTTHWFREHRGAFPSIVALLAVAVLWVAGAIGGIGFLAEASSPMMMLTGLYVGLAVVAVSIIIATLAINDLVRRHSRNRARR